MQMTNRKFGYLLLCLVTTLLTACGGSGGGTATGTTTASSVYVANSGENTISQYTIGSTGALTPKSPATVSSIAGVLNSTPSSVVVDPSGKYAYVANSGTDFISQFTVGSGGGLVPMNPPTVQSSLTAGTAPISVAVDPLGRYVYAANNFDNTVALFTIGTGGKLTFVDTYPSGSGAPPGPTSIAVDPTGKYVYVANENSNFISQYKIDTGGVLTPMANATVATGTYPVSITIDTSGKYAYVANYDGTPGYSTISQYDIGKATAGELTPMSAPTAGGSGTALLLPTSIAIDPSGTHAYVAHGNGVYLFSIVNGALTDNMITKSISSGGTAPQSIAIDSTGSFVYVANKGDNTVSVFTVGTGGTLSNPTVISVGSTNSQPYSITTSH